MALDAIDFSRHWVQAWNDHDVEAVLQHFHEDVVLTSPLAARQLPQIAYRNQDDGLASGC